jgi:hypothetical protein
MADDNLDEVALNCLLADGIDAPTAYAASIRDEQPTASIKPATDRTFAILTIGGLVAFIVWLLLH